MPYRNRLLIGLLLFLASGFVLWYGSPDRYGLGEPPPAIAYAFVVLFALGFILSSMALLATEDAYGAFLSGLVLYFVVGALVAVFIHVSGSNLSQYSLADAGARWFWIDFGRMTALWPLKLVQGAELLGWEHVRP